ncbi:MAG TPA: hypothetical protein VG893_13955 [Terracidiphilus sp.]|nr:hypothetical protein [Terracidiphilus sp.]
MRIHLSKVSAAILGVAFAVSSSAVFAYPTSPFPSNGKSGKLAAYPTSPFPSNGKSGKLA